MAGMFGIGGTARPGPTTAARAASRSGNTFRLPAGETQETTEAAATAAAAPIGLMALQGDEDAAGRNRRGAARARDLLKELAAIQADLLRGEMDGERLARLAGLAEGESPPDPVLADALAGIALRARIELARRGISVPPSVA